MNQLCVIVVLLLATFVSIEAESTEASTTTKATAKPPNRACSFQPNHYQYDWEPEANPLFIDINLIILHIRDIPDSGGSFGLDLE